MRRIAFVIVETSLHGYDTFAAEHAEYEPAGMPFYGRYREVRYGSVVYRMKYVYVFYQSAESGAEYYAGFRYEAVDFLLYEGCRLLDLL